MPRRSRVTRRAVGPGRDPAPAHHRIRDGPPSLTGPLPYPGDPSRGGSRGAVETRRRGERITRVLPPGSPRLRVRSLPPIPRGPDLDVTVAWCTRYQSRYNE